MTPEIERELREYLDVQRAANGWRERVERALEAIRLRNADSDKQHEGIVKTLSTCADGVTALNLGLKSHVSQDERNHDAIMMRLGNYSSRLDSLEAFADHEEITGVTDPRELERVARAQRAEQRRLHRLVRYLVSALVAVSLGGGAHLFLRLLGKG